ncbi:MAG: diadenylate cyclase [bacterium]|nr:diadenylate cyclase [bacterium]
MSDVLESVRIGDVVDVLLVTALVYTLVVWLRRTQSAFVALGFFLVGGLYVAAQALDLRLTTWLFHSFFAISVVMIVVIFQEELRQLFERVALWSLRRSKQDGVAHAVPSDILVETLADLAHTRVGALVVLPGRQPLERHVRGGIPLEGAVSVPLLKSVFDPHSPGHDGAVIVRGHRIERFAVHLPLSIDFAQLAGRGTRHSAALGLAELTDACCLVVSEERGEVSVARDGRLLTLRDPSELTAIVADAQRVFEPSARRQAFWGPLLREHWIEKVASLVVVSGLWLALVPGSRPVTRTFSVPVKVANLPPELQLESVQPAEITMTLTGLRREFYFVSPRLLEVTVDAALARDGRRTFQVVDSELRYPKELALENVEPDAVKLDLRPTPASEAAG